MSASCSYCGATLNFGLKFCVVCGRQTIAALNKMGGLKSGVRHGDMTRRLGDSQSAQDYRSRKKSLRFRKNIRTLSQTIFYGFIAGALFFCAVRFTLETLFPGRVSRLVGPFLDPILQVDPPKLGHFENNWASQWANKHLKPKSKKTKKAKP